jgi:hypothetical protein
MTDRQLAVLNSLVTYAAENIPGGLNEEEREVAKIVGAATLLGAQSPILGYKIGDHIYSPEDVSIIRPAP